MRELKTRFTFWYNEKHGTVGTFWAERFSQCGGGSGYGGAEDGGGLYRFENRGGQVLVKEPHGRDHRLWFSWFGRRTAQGVSAARRGHCRGGEGGEGMAWYKGVPGALPGTLYPAGRRGSGKRLWGESKGQEGVCDGLTKGGSGAIVAKALQGFSLEDSGLVSVRAGWSGVSCLGGEFPVQRLG